MTSVAARRKGRKLGGRDQTKAKAKARFDLPIGTGILDRDFDDLEDAELDLREHFIGGSEDNDG